MSAALAAVAPVLPPAPVQSQLMCARCAKTCHQDVNLECKFDDPGSNKCSRCRNDNAKCNPVSDINSVLVWANTEKLAIQLHSRARRLERLLRLLRTAPGSPARRAALTAAIKRSSLTIKRQSEAAARRAMRIHELCELCEVILAGQEKINASLRNILGLLRTQRRTLLRTQRRIETVALHLRRLEARSNISMTRIQDVNSVGQRQ